MNRTAGLARPAVGVEEARAILAEHWGLDARLTEVGSQQDRNYRAIGRDDESYLLKASNPVFSRSELEAQNAAMARLGSSGFAVPAPIPSLDGDEIVAVGRAAVPVRLLSWLAGKPLAECRTPSDQVLVEVGSLAGGVVDALRGLEHPGLHRELQWDLRRAGDVVGGLAGHIRDRERRGSVIAAAAAAVAAVAPLAGALPLQAVHGDLTDDNLVWRSDGGGLGIIDFGDVHLGWRIAELAVACSFVLHRRPSDPLAILPLVRAFDARIRLTDEEIAVLWPLIVLRGAVLAVSGAQQIAIDGGNDYARARLDAEWSVFAQAAGVRGADVAEILRSELRGAPFDPDLEGSAAVLEGMAVALADLAPESRMLGEGLWLTDAAEDAVIAATRAAGNADVVAVPFGIPRLTRAGAPGLCEPEAVPTFLELDVPTPIELSAPWRGTLDTTGPTIELDSRQGRLVLSLDEGKPPTPVSGEHRAVEAGESIATVRGRIRAWLVRPGAVTPDPFVQGSRLRAVRGIVADPGRLFGVSAPLRDDPDRELARRTGSYAAVQEHYYRRPPQIERGWREYLIDTTGRHYVDIVNNVAAVGHANPRLARVAAEQLGMLNTNSRFHYKAIADLSERLLATLPDGFDTVLLVNSGSEAVDLAIRMTRAFTGREDVACVHESYHGWTLASDAVSTALSDNPRAAETRPPWVHAFDAPNSYRGVHRGEGAGAAYAADATAEILRLAEEGHPLGGFIAEPRNGNAGAIAVPDGYLSAVYQAVRAGGGLAICDEVQVGYGRQGDVFWGFQQHPGVVPDIVTVAKAMGSGFPLGAVVTRTEIADALAETGSFFSSAGGSTFSARIGCEVFDIIRDEGLQRNAAVMGARLAAGFAALALAHPLIGAVHGRGLYQGLELVRDRSTREPADRETAWLCERMRELGVIVLPTGDRRNVLKVKPPMVIGPGAVDHVIAALGIALEELADRGDGGTDG